MQRRRYLLSTLAGLLWAGWPGLGRTSGELEARDPHPLPAESLAQLEGLFSDVAYPRAVGLRYLAAFPEHAHETILLESSGLTRLTRGPRASAVLLQRAMAESCRQDFLAGRTVTLDGWILALSEASLCGLLALRS